MDASTKILICGLGSMGKRRLRLLQKNYPDLKVYGTDIRPDRCREVETEFQIQTFSDFKTAFKRITPFAVFVCTAPKFHSEYVIHALENNSHTFSEINLDTRKYDRILEAAKANQKTAFLSSTFLYRKEIRWIMQKVTGVSNLTYRYHVGQYLPDWHPWEKYTDFFVAEAEQSACKEILAIELPWLTMAFGGVKRFETMTRTISDLELDYDDTVHILFEHDSGIQGSVSIDCVAARGIRKLDVYNHELYIEWNGTPETLSQYDREKKRMNEIQLYNEISKDKAYDAFIIENPYMEEIKAFFESIQQRKNHGRYTYKQDLDVLNLVNAIHSNQNGRMR